MATNNADWISQNPGPIFNKIFAESFVLDIFTAALVTPFDWNVQNFDFYFKNKYFFLKEYLTSLNFYLIPAPLPSNFTWFQNISIPVKTIPSLHSSLISSFNYASLDTSTLINTTGYYRRYLNDVGTLNPFIESV